ncbi:MAG: tryptophan--tRNA ligase [Candidatus Ryanbacteria bacterium RIFCSPHIGHO2_12_FULL_47_12b]|nr:MAG: Tryptophan-tRNA ligase [Parcubacteria group bacterium GW2011_GWA2_47_10b]KKU85796.1 MAG: Tryptophan-tRNA ligase [Parcubacteria group bacterium GW2011_GWA1_47_9]OGZ44683.1 MAG: tryptophan--tRNA ligase [Candidatus Ryanbacteria bacterium RIFCSPHIGHO2_01_FULL_48_80]OGZ51856.1 MAG: tryptophan--tRNA ligase [Candidatus Ryanbacteria bacterium RIFCSPHIGHO2_12_FULL_47_12b]
MPKQVLLTGMRPTSTLHVGNYFGALKPLIEYQKQYRTYLMVADIHALTTLEDTKDVRENTLKIVMLYLACGVDPKKVTLFVQSLVPEQTELATLFSMIVPKSMLELNPVYKEMLAENPKATNLGLLAYPVLQAADILAYKADFVPVGRDQLPHLELTREIARRFNTHFGKIFLEPKGLAGKELKILSLQDPAKKMSKSHGEQNHISLLDSPDQIRRKIKSAVTDSGKAIVYLPNEKPAISNLILLMHLASGESIKKIEQRFVGRGYAEFKEATASALVMFLEPIQIHYRKISRDKKAIARLLIDGSKKARAIAVKTLTEAKRNIGLLFSTD